MPTRHQPTLRLLPPTTRRPSAGGGLRPMHPHLTLVPIGPGFGADRRPTSITSRRASGSTASEEPIAMYSNGQLQNVQIIHALARRDAMLAEAEQERRVAQAERASSVRHPVVAAVATLRLALGATLVRAGQRLQGAGAASAADALPSIATLRAAR